MTAQRAADSRPPTHPSLRWWIGGLLMVSTIINYLDRQTLSVLAPYLKRDYGLEQSGFREDRHLFPPRLCDRSERLRPADGSSRNAARADGVGALVFGRGDVEFARDRPA